MTVKENPRQDANAAYYPQRVTLNDLVQSVAGVGNDRSHHYQAQFIQQAPISWLVG